MKNTSKNTGGVTGKGFDVVGQPTPDSKRKGWARRKAAQSFMDTVMLLQSMTIKEFEALQKQKKTTMTVGEVMAMNYVAGAIKTDKFLLDWVDRHIAKATQPQADSEGYDPITKIVVEVIDSNPTAINH